MEGSGDLFRFKVRQIAYQKITRRGTNIQLGVQAACLAGGLFSQPNSFPRYLQTELLTS